MGGGDGEKTGRSWAELDSNQRRREPADLQSAPFGHFGIRPERERLAKKWCGVKRVPVGSKIASGGGVRVGFEFTRC